MSLDYTKKEERIWEDITIGNLLNRKKLSDLTQIKEGKVKNIINCLLENVVGV